MTPARARLWALAGGAGAALGQAPVGLWPATLLGFAGAFILFQRATTARQAAWRGWYLGVGYFAIALSWIIEPFLVDIARHGWMAPFALVFMAGGLALFWAVAFWGAYRLGAGALVWGAALVLAEATRSYVLTGFPWALIGHVWIDTALAQWAAVWGALGLTAVTLVGAVGLAKLPSTPRIGSAMLLVIAGLFVAGYALRGPPKDLADRPIVRLVQPNAPQHQKWHPDHMQGFFDRQVAYSAAPGAGDTRPDLIVWPETAIPVLLHNSAPTLAYIAEAAGGVPVVLGLQRVDGLRLYNTLVAVGPQGQVTSHYDKHHLVPFGEYLPFGQYLKRFGLRGLAADDGNGYSAGPGPQVIGLGDLGRALPLICYEGVFAQDVAGAPGRADMMILITNDAWFGRLSGPYQHLAQARLRAIEQGLPMIRVANTGISAMIDAKGRVTGSLPLGEAGWVDLALPMPGSETVYARSGDGPWVVVLLLMIGFAGLRAVRK